jgi:hypothetical protein
MAITEWIDERPDLTLASLKAKLSQEKNVNVSLKTISKTLTKIGFTFKLLRTIPISWNTPETILGRKPFAMDFIENAPFDRQNILWIDEVGFNLHIHRSHGRAHRGQRASIQVPNSQGRNISVCAAMSQEGLIHTRVVVGSTNVM